MSPSTPFDVFADPIASTQITAYALGSNLTAPCTTAQLLGAILPDISASFILTPGQTLNAFGNCVSSMERRFSLTLLLDMVDMVFLVFVFATLMPLVWLLDTLFLVLLTLYSKSGRP